MKMKFYLVLMIALSCFFSAEKAEARTWTSISGATVEADFVSESWGTVTLKKEDGKDMQIRLSQLIPNDQTYIRSGKAKEEAASASAGGEEGGEASRTGDALLPPMPPPNQDYHAIVTKPMYTAKLLRNGDLIIIPTPRKAPLDSPYVLPVSQMYLNRGGFWYGIPKEKRNGRPGHNRRLITKITSSIRTGVNPQEVEMEGVAEDGVEFEYVLKFENDGFCWSMKMDDPKDIEFPSNWAWGMRTPTTHKFDKDVELPAQKEATKGYYVEIKGHENIEHPFWKSMTRGIHGVDRVIIHGVFPGVAVEVNSKGDGSRFNVGPGYAGQPLFPRFHMSRHMAERSGKVTVCMTFEADM